MKHGPVTLKNVVVDTLNGTYLIMLYMLWGGGRVKTQNGKWLDIDRWDLIIAHPPCTYLSNAATAHHSLKSAAESRIEGRTLLRIQAMDFFMRCIMSPCEKIAVENPVGIMNTAFRKPDQIIEPYQFADSAEDTENYVTKRTCLWLKGLPALKTNNLPRPDNKQLFGVLSTGKINNWTDAHKDPLFRSKTFPGIARAMAEQWG